MPLELDFYKLEVKKILKGLVRLQKELAGDDLYSVSLKYLVHVKS